MFQKIRVFFLLLRRGVHWFKDSRLNYYHVAPQPTKQKKRGDVSSLRKDEASKRGDEFRQIAAWQLLYQGQRPTRYPSRLQMIPSPNIDFFGLVILTL